MSDASPQWITDMINAAIEYASELGMSMGFTIPEGVTFTVPTEYHGYRTEPIPGAELGGQPRNPETDVLDEIDRLVDWQLEKGGGW